jgi:diguanylate cyclase (GGDEF)-like protein/PAS domain S-box-containing protein
VRISTKLGLIAGSTTVALLVLAPELVWSTLQFRSAKQDSTLASNLKLSLLEQTVYRDQYFLHREDHAHAQWDRSSSTTDQLISQARVQLVRAEDVDALERLVARIERSGATFHRIVAHAGAFPAADLRRMASEQQDKVSYGELVLNAAALNDELGTLENLFTHRADEAFRRMTFSLSLFALTLALAVILVSIQLRRLIKRRLAPLHEGARIIADGDLDFRVPVTGSDEFTELAASFNTMSDRLRQFTRHLEQEIAERTRHQQALSEAEHLYRSLANGVSTLIWKSGTDKLCNFFNEHWLRFTGRKLEQEMGNGWVEGVHPDDSERCLDIYATAFDLREPFKMEYRLHHADGTYHWIRDDGSPAFDRQGTFVGYIGTCTDINDRKKNEESLQLAASVFTHAREGIVITDPDGSIIDVNDTFCEITGYSRSEVRGRNPRMLSSGRQDSEFYAALWKGLLEKGHWSGEIWNRRKNGEVYVEMLTISAVRDDGGRTRHYVAIFSDITFLKEHERQLEHIAHHDALTGLPNRVLLVDRLHQAMAQAQRRATTLAVVYLDLDGFKAINDRHGHHVGDQLLITVANRARQTLREGDTLARLGGDEFAAVLLDLNEMGDSVALIARMLAAASQPVRTGDLAIQISASAGVAFYPQLDEVDADQLLRQADQAMYQAKLAGKNRYHVFDAEHDRNVRGHHGSLENIRLALAKGQFVLHYQPKVNMRTGAMVGAEALIRWQHPEQGLLMPGVFLPVIENHPLAIEVGEWVINEALRQLEQWQSCGLNLPVSVNISAIQLQQTDFVERLRRVLADHPGVRPGYLEMEVLETSALENVARVSKVIEDCRELGITFALDDFGTGYSSLTYLKRLPVMQLKIDQSFVRDMLDDPEDLVILEGVIALADSFGRQTIAEGVETVEHGRMLLQLGCELAQGYGIARPMPADDMPAWSRAWKPDTSWVGLMPVRRDDLPPLFASSEHRSWMASVIKYLSGQGPHPSHLDYAQCRFARWLYSLGLPRYGTQPGFHSVEASHRRVHVLATELCELFAGGRPDEALAGLTRLHELQNAFQGDLKAFVQKNMRSANIQAV